MNNITIIAQHNLSTGCYAQCTAKLDSKAITTNLVGFLVASQSISQSSLHINTENLYPNLSENFLPWSELGLYRLQCLENGKVYIGESVNVLTRLEKNMLVL